MRSAEKLLVDNRTEDALALQDGYLADQPQRALDLLRPFLGAKILTPTIPIPHETSF